MSLLLIVNVMIKKMPEHTSRHYHQNKCAINHYFENDSIILRGHDYIYAPYEGSQMLFLK